MTSIIGTVTHCIAGKAGAIMDIFKLVTLCCCGHTTIEGPSAPLLAMWRDSTESSEHAAGPF